MKILVLMLTLFTSTMSTQNSFAQDCLIGEIRMFAGNFAPRGWGLCQGQLLPISQNSALFSILGTTYGGDGRPTFGLLDLRGHVPIGSGKGPGLEDVFLGQRKNTQGASGNNGPPSLGLNFIICINGQYPSRN